MRHFQPSNATVGTLESLVFICENRSGYSTAKGRSVKDGSLHCAAICLWLWCIHRLRVCFSDDMRVAAKEFTKDGSSLCPIKGSLSIWPNYLRTIRLRSEEDLVDPNSKVRRKETREAEKGTLRCEPCRKRKKKVHLSSTFTDISVILTIPMRYANSAKSWETFVVLRQLLVILPNYENDRSRERKTWSECESVLRDC